MENLPLMPANPRCNATLRHEWWSVLTRHWTSRVSMARSDDSGTQPASHHHGKQRNKNRISERLVHFVSRMIREPQISEQRHRCKRLLL